MSSVESSIIVPYVPGYSKLTVQDLLFWSGDLTDKEIDERNKRRAAIGKQYVAEKKARNARFPNKTFKSIEQKENMEYFKLGKASRISHSGGIQRVTAKKISKTTVKTSKNILKSNN
jgi:hypothetical protein